MGNDTSFGSENFNPALIYRGEGKHELSSVKDISSGNMVHPYEKERLEFEKTTGIYRKNWSDGIGIAQSPSKIWERSFSAWLIYVKINELEEKIAAIANAAAAVLRVAKKNPIEGSNFVKFIQRMEYLEELVEKERGNIAPHPEEFIDDNDTQELDSKVKP